MAFDPHPLLETIHERFYYDNGQVRVKKAGKWKGKKDDLAGTVRPDGRIIIQIKQSRLFAHQVVWLLFNDGLPETSIDHKDRDQTNNRIDNLRPASRTEQQGNKGLQKNNSTGFKGVSFKKGVKEKPWVATIKSEGRAETLGYFSTPEAAAKAYDASARNKFGVYAKTNF